MQHEVEPWFLFAIFAIVCLVVLLDIRLGGKISKALTDTHVPSARPTASSPSSSTWVDYGNQNSPNSQHNPYYSPQHHPVPATAPSYAYASQIPKSGRRLDRKYSRIADDYYSLDEVTSALSHAGLESSNLIIGIDFTKSNEWTGAMSFNRKSLHHIGSIPNPYEQAISIIGKTLSAFDDDNLIPCYGFGDASTHDQDVFSFYPDDKFCHGFEEVLERYREIVPHLRLAGPTSFAPIIEMAISIVEKSGGQYHVLLIIADGQVTRSVDTENGQLSPQERKTVEAIVKASEYPLSIVLVGVGDGPWDMMKEFDDNIPARAFDNFQFVNFTEIMSKNVDPTKKETEFALAALMEIPSQYKATLEHDLLGNRRQRGNSMEMFPLPPPRYTRASSNSRKESNTSYSFHRSTPSYTNNNTEATRTPSSSYQDDNKVCPICLASPKDMAFGCGHRTCCECGEDLQVCPLCRSDISTRIKLY